MFPYKDSCCDEFNFIVGVFSGTVRGSVERSHD